MANQATCFIDSTEQTARAVEVPDADFAGGMNTGGSCAPGIGVNTGDINPKLSDWPVRSPERIENSQLIGKAASAIFTKDPTFGANALVAYVTAAGAVAPDATINVNVEGFAIVNRTGKAMVAGDRAWGAANNP